jgi:S1-C subfamily serine protease
VIDLATNNTDVLAALSGAIEELARNAAPSLVSLGSEHGTGTGIVIDDQRHILTAGHVVHRQREVSVGTNEGSPLQGKVLGRNPYADLALVEATSGKLKPLKLGRSRDARVGQFVLALARTHGGSPSVTSGIITGVNRQIGGWWRFSIGNAIVTDARLNPGYSGGPLIDAKGDMIGMNVAYFSNRGIAVPMDAINKDIDRLVRGEGFKRAYLGIVSNPIQLPDELASRLNLEQRGGLMILSVEPESSAKKAGLVLGDVVVKFRDNPVNNLQDLESLLNEDAIGKEARITVLRQEQQKELTVIPSVVE